MGPLRELSPFLLSSSFQSLAPALFQSCAFRLFQLGNLLTRFFRFTCFESKVRRYDIVINLDAAAF